MIGAIAGLDATRQIFPQEAARLARRDVLPVAELLKLGRDPGTTWLRAFWAADRPPQPGEKHLYVNRIEWHWYQKYLPQHLSLDERSLPNEEWFPFRDTEIHLDRYRVPGRRGVVILLHGGGGNGRVLSPFARMLDGLGVEVVAPDLPGYGLSVRSRRLQPSYALWTELTHELIGAERATDGVPVVVFGLSLGGLLAYVPAARNRHVAGLVATTLVDARRIIAMATIGRNAVVGAGGATVRLGFLRSLMSVRPAGEPENFDVCPVLLAHPEIDPWTPVELSRPFIERIPAPKTLEILQGCGHFPMEDLGRGQLESALRTFVESVL
jgi:alpha-beta hydrolase superfamily lysophospholipase